MQWDFWRQSMRSGRPTTSPSDDVPRQPGALQDFLPHTVMKWGSYWPRWCIAVFGILLHKLSILHYVTDAATSPPVAPGWTSERKLAARYVCAEISPLPSPNENIGLKGKDSRALVPRVWQLHELWSVPGIFIREPSPQRRVRFHQAFPMTKWVVALAETWRIWPKISCALSLAQVGVLTGEIRASLSSWLLSSQPTFVFSAPILRPTTSPAISHLHSSMSLIPSLFWRTVRASNSRSRISFNLCPSTSIPSLKSSKSLYVFSEDYCQDTSSQASPGNPSSFPGIRVSFWSSQEIWATDSFLRLRPPPVFPLLGYACLPLYILPELNWYRSTCGRGSWREKLGTHVCADVYSPNRCADPGIGAAGAGTLILEFGTLSRLTGDERYEKAARRAFFGVWNRKSDVGLVGNTINTRTGVRSWHCYLSQPLIHLCRNGRLQSSRESVLGSTPSTSMRWNGTFSQVRVGVTVHVIVLTAAVGEIEYLDVFDDAYAAVMRYSRSPDGYWVSVFLCTTYHAFSLHLQVSSSKHEQWRSRIFHHWLPRRILAWASSSCWWCRKCH